MNRTHFVTTLGVCVFAAALVGCQQPNMADMMTPPERPAELDQLDMLVGTWVGAATMKVPGMDEAMEWEGRNITTWEADKWLLVEQYEHGDTSSDKKGKGLAVWMWDPQIKKFRTWWFASGGNYSTGIASYDEAERVWHYKSKSTNPYNGMKTSGEGTATMVDNDTMEWEWVEKKGLIPTKFMEMTGTTHREK